MKQPMQRCLNLWPGRIGVVTAVLGAGIAGCSAERQDARLSPLGTPEPLESPAGPGSGEPFLSPTSSGALLSWLEPVGEDAVELRFARFDGAAWSAPRPIVRRPDFFVNWADFPSILELPDGRLATHWLQREGPGTYAYGVRVAFSEDGGETWSEPVSPHTDGTLTEHGFVSLYAAEDGHLGVVWLDGRNMGAGEGHGGGDMTLRSAIIRRDGSLSLETELDARTCECCQTSVALAASGPVAVYRDRSPTEIRDIAIVRHSGGGWTEPVRVHADDWTIAGCPVNGPSVSADGSRVVVAWFTAPDDEPRVNVAFSDDGGTTFGPPVRIDHGLPAGRVDTMLLDADVALVSWLERTEDGAVVRARRVGADGRMGPARDVAASSGERSSGFPRMTRQGDSVLFAWTDPQRPSRVRVARVPLRPVD